MATLPWFLMATWSLALTQDRAGAPTLSAPKAEVYFVDMKDGDKIDEMKVHFGLRNMGVAPLARIGRTLDITIFWSIPTCRRSRLPERPASPSRSNRDAFPTLTPCSSCSPIRTTFHIRPR